MNQSISLRLAQPQDAPALLAIYAPYVQNTAITFEYEVPSVGEFADRIRRTLARYPYLVAEQDGTIIGYAYASAFHARKAYEWCAETSIYVDQTCKRTGVGRRLYEALEQILRKQNILNLNACIACPQIEDEHLNNDSIRFHAHMGYQMVGKFHACGYKFDRWYDMVWMEKHIGAHHSNQPDFIPFADIAGQFQKF